MSCATIHQLPELGGGSRTYVVEPPAVLLKVTWAELATRPFFIRFPSADVYAWSSVTRLIAFSENFDRSYIHLVGDAQGSLVAASTRTPNGLPNSLLLITIQPDQEEVGLSLRDLFLSEWKRLVDANLMPDSKRSGEPLFTAQLFPEGQPKFSSAGMYLRLKQSILINDGIRNGYATIHIDLRPYKGDDVVRVELVDKSASYLLVHTGTPTGGHWDYSMARGFFGPGVWVNDYGDPLIPPWFQPMVERVAGETVSRLNARLRTVLGAPADPVIPPKKPVRALYVLPGRHIPLPTSRTPLSGYVTEDATIVAIR